MCFRGVAQLVARLVRDQEAVGSNPATSTKLMHSAQKISLIARLGLIFMLSPKS